MPGIDYRALEGSDGADGGGGGLPLPAVPIKPRHPLRVFCTWMLRLVCWGCAVSFFAMVCMGAYVVFAPSFWQGEGGMTLVGEAYIATAEDAARFADLAVDEVVSILEDTRRWHTVERDEGLLVESIRVDHGPYAKSKILLVRMNLTLSGVDSERLPGDTVGNQSLSRRAFDFLMTKEGYTLIDPDSNPDTFNQWLEEYPWRGTKLGIQEAQYPPSHELTVMNAYDSERQIFVSKSVDHRSMPGSSIYARNWDTASGRTRGVIQFGLRTREGAREGEVVVETEFWMDSWLDRGLIGNWVNCFVILQGFAHRLRKRITGDGCKDECKCNRCNFHCRKPPSLYDRDKAKERTLGTEYSDSGITSRPIDDLDDFDERATMSE
mmetsp:Transcript_10208/g.19978  ORF Transcript_10208/g.19978 Transcript_10208/m.19978 type:complete len:379 (+) Transcript_10208:50-1186(+)